MLKRILFLIIICVLLFPFDIIVVSAEENNIDATVNEIIENLDLNSLNDWLTQIIHGKDLNEILTNMVKGGFVSNEELSSIVVGYFKSSFTPLVTLFIQLFSIILICSILSSLKPDNNQLKEIIFLVCYCAIGVAIFGLSIKSINSVKGIITSLSMQIESVFPILLTVMTAIGAKTSVAVYQPLCAGVVTIISSIINGLLLPIVEINACLAVGESLNERFSLKKFSIFLGDVFKWIVGITIAIFSFFSVVKSITAAVYDNMSIRALKYTIANSFPLVSGFAKEGVDVVLTSAILIKNAIGGVAIILLFFALLAPFFEILLLSLFFKFMQAICEPIADNRIIHLLSSFAKIVGMLATLLIMIFVLYFVILILVIVAQNGLVL